jgi:hypothetical protein
LETEWPEVHVRETGVKGGKWFSLIDKVYRLDNFRSAFAKVKANRGSAGVDHQTIEMFESRLEENLARLHQELKDGTYRPQAIKRVHISKPGSKERRPLGIPTVRDRVVQTAIRQVVEPIFERDFAEQSYGFRPWRGCKGWFEYYKHAHKWTFKPLDGWIRMRLRSVLRKPRGGKGRGRGLDHYRWPNSFFADHGLFSLVAAHELACQSARR